MDFNTLLKLKEPLGIKCAKFDGANFFLKDIPGSTMPLDILVLMYHVFTSKDHAYHKKRLYDLGKLQSKAILSKLIGDFQIRLSMDNLKLLLQVIAISGFGNIKVVRADFIHKKFIFKLKSAFAEQYLKLFRTQKLPVDNFICGLLSGCLEHYFKEKFNVKETACIVQGKTMCVFEAVTK